jgi:hypothetical protein
MAPSACKLCSRRLSLRPVPLPDISAFRFLLRPGRLLLGLLALLPLLSRAQVVDDSTKVLFGPKTTLVVREADVLRNLTEGSILDTTLTGIHNTRNWYYDSTYQQDLGNVGTASRRLLWHTNTQLGARFGRTAYDRYFRDPANIPYYDTRSPYSFFRFVQGSQGEQVFEGSFSRSIKKLASLGAAYERFGANKQLGTANPRDGQVTHSGVLLFGRYKSKHDRYYLLGNYYTARHRVVEQGGIRPNETDVSLRQLFDYRAEQVWLTQAQSFDNRNSFHLAQTYKLLGRGFTAFHVLDWRRQTNRYTDDRLQFANNALVFYPRARLDSARTQDSARYRQFENTLGLLGRTDFLEYRLYGRLRNAALRSGAFSSRAERPNRPQNFQLNQQQVFVGGDVAFRWRKVFGVQVAGEYKFFDEAWLRGSLRFGPLTGELLYSSFSPTLTEQRFTGNHYHWDNTDRFNNTTVNQLRVALDQPIGGASARLQQRLQASASVVNINQLVFYNIAAEPEQLGGADANRQLLIGTLRHRLRYGVLRADNEVVVTRGGDGPGLRIPPIVGNSRLYLEGYLFRKALFSQIGVEAFYRDRFQPYGYSPSLQQFFVQNDFTTRSYSVIDVFVTADIKTVSVFLKMAYVNQGIGRDGYFATPYYTGTPRSFQVGLRWNFFD